MSAALSTVTPAASRASDDYADVVVMFRQLANLPEESHEFAQLRATIIDRCLPLAEHVARHFDRRGEDHDDLLQVARLGLVGAVNRFDPLKSDSFVGFAVPTMMGEVRRHFRDHGWSLHVPRRIKDRHVQIRRATKDLTQTLRRAPNASEIAELLGIDRDEVVDSLIAAEAYAPLSLDAPISSGDGQPKPVAELHGSLDAGFDFVTDRETLRPLLAALPDRDRTVLYLRFFCSMNQTQIAERIGVSQMHVSRILSKTLRVLREQLL